MPDLPDNANVFGIDYGTRRIGLAMAGLRLREAAALGIMNNTNGTPDWSALDRHVAEWEPAAFVLGWPLELDGSEPPIIAHVRGFLRRLTRRYERPVFTMDERYSSTLAEQRIAERRRDGRQKRRSTHADVDAEAAAVILGRWLASQPDADEQGRINVQPTPALASHSETL